MRLIVDNREHIKHLFQQPCFVDPLKQLDPTFEVVVQALDVGDYLIEKTAEDRLCIERKTIADLAASISDGRHREQKGRLLEAHGTARLLFIIEGNPHIQVAHSRINPYTIVSSLMNTMYRDGCKVLLTRSEAETVSIISYLITKMHKTGLIAETTGGHEEHLQQQVKIKKKENITPDFLVRSLMSTIPGISYQMAADITESSAISCIADLVSLTLKGRDVFIADLNDSYVEARPGRRRIIGLAGKIYDMITGACD